MTLATITGTAWLLDKFASDMRGICHVVLISADGLLLSASRTLPRERAEEVAAAVGKIVAELGASGPGDMGKVMGAVKTQLAGKADMGQVSAAVKAALAPR